MKAEALGPDAWPEIFALLDRHWRGLSNYVRIAASFGADWREFSTPFGVRVDGELVAHAGVWDLPALVLDGEVARVAGIHAVITVPQLRGRGLARECLTAALAHAESQAPRQLLYAVEPRVYEGLGFRRAEARRYQLDLTRSAAGSGSARPLDLGDASQRRQLLELAAGRHPLSPRLAVVDGGPLLIVDEVLGTGGRGGRLWWIDEETVLAAELLGRELHVYDLVSRAPRSLSDVALALEGRFRRVFVYFDVEALPLGAPLEALSEPVGDVSTSERGVQGRLRPRRLPFGDVPMLRGASTEAELSFALSPLAHC